MFSFLKADPIKKLERKYEKTLEQAMNMQRNGDIRRYSELTEEAEQIQKEMENLKAR